MTTLITSSFDGPATRRSLLSALLFVKTFRPILFYQIAAFMSVDAITLKQQLPINIGCHLKLYFPFLRGFRGDVEIPAAASICGVTPDEDNGDGDASPTTEVEETLLTATPVLTARALARQLSHQSINGLAM